MDRLKTVEWLDLLKKEYNLKSDNQVAKEIGVTRQTISGYRKGKAFMSAKVAVVIAAKLGIWPILVLACTFYEQAHTEEDKQFWEMWFNRWQQYEKRQPMQQAYSNDRRAPPINPDQAKDPPEKQTEISKRIRRLANPKKPDRE